jgi:hypothetical protein
LPSGAERLFSRLDQVGFARYFLKAAAGGLGQDEGKQRAEDRYASSEEQGAAQPERGLQDGEEEYPDERPEFPDASRDAMTSRTDPGGEQFAGQRSIRAMARR